MYNANKPDPSELPSTVQLLRSTVIAAVTALILLVTVVLPAEYGVDPTGMGSILGLTEMGRIKMQLAEEAHTEEAKPPANTAVSKTVSTAHDDHAHVDEHTQADDHAHADDHSHANGHSHIHVPDENSSSAQVEEESPLWRDEIVFSLAADAAAEYKLVMKEGASAEFEWFTNGAKANFDTHADRPGLSYYNYEKGSLARQEGTLTAAFDGSHGWFWRNRSGAPLTITLRTRGDYAEIKKVI